MNRQYAVTEMIEIVLDTASYQIPISSNHPGVQQYESPYPTRLEDGKLFFDALSIVYRLIPHGKKEPDFDAMDYRLYTTFNSTIAPHNALHLLDAANERDIAYMKNAYAMTRVAVFHGNPRLLTDDDRYVISSDIEARLQKRLNIRSRSKALQGESNE